MTTQIQLNDLDLSTEVREAVRHFGLELTNTPQFVQFKQAAEALEQDEEAQRALAAYQQKQQSLQVVIRLNALTDEERLELDRLHEAVFSRSTVTEYIQAQNAVVELFSAVNDVVSNRLGLRFAQRRGGCCG